MAHDTDIPLLDRQEQAPVAVVASSRSTRDVISVYDAWLFLVHERRFIALVTLTCALLGLATAFILPKQYTAVTTILPPQQNSSLSSLLSSQIGGLGTLGSLASGNLGGLRNPNEIYIGMLQSVRVEEAIVNRFDLRSAYHASRLSDARKGLETRSEVLTTKNGFIRISVEDRDPKRAAQLANAYVEELQKVTAAVAVTEAGQRRLFFERQLEDAKDKLATAEQQFKQTQQQTGLLQLDGQTRAIIESVAQLRAQIATKEVEIQALRTYATDENPDLTVSEKELGGLRQQLALAEQRSGGGNGDLHSASKGIPEAGLEYANRLRDVKYYETIFDILARQFEVAKLDEARQGATIQVLDPATEPDRKSSPKRMVILLCATFLGLLGSIAFLIGRKLVWSMQTIRHTGETA